MNPLLHMHIKAGIKTGDWSGLQGFLKTAGPGEHVAEEVIKKRFYAGCCIACGRDPCDGCEMKSPMWCEVCWGLIVRNCPNGMVVSGLARVMQQLTYKRPKATYTAQECMDRLLSLETPEDAAKIRAALEAGWESDWNGAFGRAARKVFK